MLGRVGVHVRHREGSDGTNKECKEVECGGKQSDDTPVAAETDGSYAEQNPEEAQDRTRAEQPLKSAVDHGSRGWLQAERKHADERSRAAVKPDDPERELAVARAILEGRALVTEEMWTDEHGVLGPNASKLSDRHRRRKAKSTEKG